MYFIKITASYTPNNSLKKYLFDQLNKLECLTIKDPEELKKHLEKLVFRANLSYKRCTPVKAYVSPSHVKDNYTAGINELIQFSLYHQRGEFVSLEQQRQAASKEQQGEQGALFPFQPSTH